MTIESVNRWLDRFLFRHGFVHDEVRGLMRSQLVVGITSSIVLLALLRFSDWSIGFAAGAALVTFNLWALARVIMHLMGVTSGAVFTLLMIFYGKLLLSGVVLYFLIGVLMVPVWGLVLGLSTVVMTLTTWGLMHFGHKRA